MTFSTICTSTLCILNTFTCIVIKIADKMGLKQKETKGKKEVKKSQKKSKTDSNVDIGKVHFKIRCNELLRENYTSLGYWKKEG